MARQIYTKQTISMSICTEVPKALLKKLLRCSNILILHMNSLHLMVTVPPLSPLSPSLACFEPFLKEQLDTMSESEDQLYSPSTWNIMFPSYIFDALLAETDNSLIWRGRGKINGETVALKITEVFDAETSQNIHQKKQNAFLWEHRLAHMAEVRDIINAKDFRLIAMKEYPYNLTDLMRQFTNTPKRYTQQHFDFVRYAFAAVVAAVDEIHSLGYVHRDLKPDNFLGDAEWNIVVTDFALITKQHQVDASLSGTLQYLAPERLSKKRRQSPVKKSNDVWALGIILFELLTGETLFDGQSQEEVLEAICEGYRHPKEIPPLGTCLINQILEVDISKRLTMEGIKKHPFLHEQVKKEEVFTSISLYL